MATSIKKDRVSRWVAKLQADDGLFSSPSNSLWCHCSRKGEQATGSLSQWQAGLKGNAKIRSIVSLGLLSASGERAIHRLGEGPLSWVLPWEAPAPGWSSCGCEPPQGARVAAYTEFIPFPFETTLRVPGTGLWNSSPGTDPSLQGLRALTLVLPPENKQ